MPEVMTLPALAPAATLVTIAELRTPDGAVEAVVVVVTAPPGAPPGADVGATCAPGSP